MRQPLRVRALLGVSFAVMLLAPAVVPAQEPAERDTTMSAVPLPGGLAAARAALNDSLADPSALLIDVIRRSFETPVGTKGLRRQETMRPLLDAFARSRGGSRPPVDVVPLPLTPALWTSAMFGGRALSGSLVDELLRSPSASLMYCALLALDPATRQWFGSNPALLTEITERHAAAFLLASPGIRVANGSIQVPGDAAAVPGWQALVGRQVTDPLDFVRALLAGSEGRLAYFYGAAAQLTPVERRVLLSLDTGDVASRTAAARRMLAVFERVATGWDILERPFWRPSLDPALLVSDLAIDAGGVPHVPGTAAFWTLVFGDDSPLDRDIRERGGIAGGAPADFTRLCEQIFTGGQAVIRTPYQQVLFASRRIASLTPDLARDAVAATRAAAQYPALIAALERARITALPVYAAAARRAAALASIDDDRRAALTLTQFQGALAIVGRALARGSIDQPHAAAAIAALAAIDPDGRGDYAGQVVDWLGGTVGGDRGAGVRSDGDAAHNLDDRVLTLISGPAPLRTDIVDWEGTRYRVDPASAESMRLRRLLDDPALPYLTTAASLVAAATVLEGNGLTPPALTRQAENVDAALVAVACDGPERRQSAELGTRCREIVTVLARAARAGDTKNATRVAPRLRLLADTLVARGLIDLVYAMALGQPDGAPIHAADAASRHDFGFGLPGFGRLGAWRRPAAGADRMRNWHVTGSLLGLDVVLAPLALARVSSRPPATRPTLNDEDRRVLTETVVLIEGPQLTGTDHQSVVAAMRRGRERLAGSRSDGDLQAIAAALDLAPARRTLLFWAASHSAAAARLSPHELLLLGLADGPRPARLDAWGAPGDPRSGCSCLQLPLRGKTDLFTGRWHTGVMATGFPDLNLRLAEMLAELRMPAALLPSVLASATWDLVLTVRSRDFDDRQGLVDYVDALTIDRVEQYLALLTTDGPLVPLADGSASAAQRSHGAQPSYPPQPQP
jgi:hypothetical protein